MGSVDSSGRRYRYYVPRVGRSPHGERGFKLHKIWIQGVLRRSLPAWGAWIQVGMMDIRELNAVCRSPHGERGFKWFMRNTDSIFSRSFS